MQVLGDAEKRKLYDEGLNKEEIDRRMAAPSRGAARTEQSPEETPTPVQTPRRLVQAAAGIVGKLLGSESPAARKKVLLLDEVDVFFSDSFYGKPYRPCEMLNDVRQLNGSHHGYNLLYYVWENRGSLRNTPQNIAKLRSLDHTRELVKIFPNFVLGSEEGVTLLDIELGRILDAVSRFPVKGESRLTAQEKDYQIRPDGRIYYTDPATGGPSLKASFGYVTAFTYHYEIDRGQIDPKILLDKSDSEGLQCSTIMGMEPVCGVLSYSQIPEYYDFSLGMTGTLDCLTDMQNQLLTEYAFNRHTFLPSTFAKKKLNDGRSLEQTKTIVLGSREEYNQALKGEIQANLMQSRATLVVFDTWVELKKFETCLKDYPLDHPRFQPPQKLTDDEMSSETRSDTVHKAIRPHAITLMTRSYGRGTDFVCYSETLVKSGGVHVIVTFFPEDASEEKQIFGRTCRQDDPGSARKIIFEDTIKPLGASIEDFSNRYDESSPWEPYLSKCREKSHKEKMEKMFESHKNVMEKHDITISACAAAKRKQWKEAGQLFFEAARPVEVATSAAISSLDICFVMDCTGSMAGSISACQEQVITIAENLKARLCEQGSSAAVRMSFVAYRDWDLRGMQQYTYGGVQVEPFTEDIERLRNMVRAQEASGGADGPEDICGGLRAALEMEWESQQRVLFLVADAPCHGSKYHPMGDHYPQGDPLGDHPEEQIEELIEEHGVSVKFMRLGSCTDQMISVFNQHLTESGTQKSIETLELSECGADGGVNFGEVVERAVQSEWVHRS